MFARDMPYDKPFTPKGCGEEYVRVRPTARDMGLDRYGQPDRVILRTTAGYKIVVSGGVEMEPLVVA